MSGSIFKQPPVMSIPVFNCGRFIEETRTTTKFCYWSFELDIVYLLPEFQSLNMFQVLIDSIPFRVRCNIFISIQNKKPIGRSMLHVKVSCSYLTKLAIIAFDKINFCLLSNT